MTIEKVIIQIKVDSTMDKWDKKALFRRIARLLHQGFETRDYGDFLRASIEIKDDIRAFTLEVFQISNPLREVFDIIEFQDGTAIDLRRKKL